MPRVDTVYKKGQYAWIDVSGGKHLVLSGDIDRAFVKGGGSSLVMAGHLGLANLDGNVQAEVVGSVNSASLGEHSTLLVIGEVGQSLIDNANYNGGRLIVHGKVGNRWVRRKFTGKGQ